MTEWVCVPTPWTSHPFASSTTATPTKYNKTHPCHMSLGGFLSKWIFFFVPSLLSYFQLSPCCFVFVNCSFQITCNISLPNLGLPNFAPRFLVLDEHISNSIKACFVYLLSSHKLGSKV
jgi:hypothetical protein